MSHGSCTGLRDIILYGLHAIRRIILPVRIGNSHLWFPQSRRTEKDSRGREGNYYNRASAPETTAREIRRSENARSSTGTYQTLRAAEPNTSNSPKSIIIVWIVPRQYNKLSNVLHYASYRFTDPPVAVIQRGGSFVAHPIIVVSSESADFS